MHVTQIVLELLTACNFHCQYCRDDSGKGKQIPFEKAKEIISKFKPLGIRKVQLDGGEPFLYKQIFELIDYITDNGLETGIYTNASLVDQSTAQRLASYRKLKLAVTLHPLNEENEIHATFQGLRVLADAGIFPNLIMVISQKSLSRLPEVLSKIPGGEYTLILNPLVSSGKAFDNSLEQIDAEGKLFLRETIKDAELRYEHISIIDNVAPDNVKIEKIQMNDEQEFALHINTDGEVLPFFSADSDTSIGNVENFDELRDVLQSPQTLSYLELSREAMKNRIYGRSQPEYRKILRKDILSVTQ